ncbi:MAG TPA: PAS domain S-box protein, partial [Agriterribacter sp.]|nr:PAS domain S-box protein [Agriterribacter sp.]
MAAKDQMIDKTYFIRDGGEMGKRIRSFDWCKTPLGAIENWPGNLGNLVNLCLHSRFPMFIFWGETHITIYNDAYSKIMGLKHPGALGEPAKTVWPEIWSKIGSILETIMQTGKAAVCNNNLLLLNRNGFIEETYFTFSYSPVEGENGKTEGIFCIATETTEAVTGERQLQTLTRLNKNILNVTSDHDVYQKSMEAIRENPEDFPFAILYALSRDGKKLLIADQTTNTLAKFFPNEIDLSENKGEYHELVDAALKNVPVICTEMKEPFGQLPRTNGEQTPVTGLVLPVAHSQQKIPYAILKVGINPHRIFDNKYQLFFELVANQIANGINKSRIGEMRNAFPGADYNLANPYAVKELLEGNEAQVKMALSKKHIEQQFGQLLEQAPVAIALLRGPSFVVDIMNEVALDILGKPSAQLMNKPLFESIPELKKQGFETVVNGVFTTGKGVVIEETPVQMVRHGKEETIFARIVFKALYEENGTISGVMAAAHDMTEHVTARKKIEVSETRYRQLVQGISIALYTCDKEGRILLYNDAAVELWGREPEVGVDLWCGSWKTLDSHGQKLDLANCPIAVALKYGRVESFEIIVERPDGTRRHVMPYPQPMFDDKGNITGAINLLLDITENKKVMAALQHSE